MTHQSSWERAKWSCVRPVIHARHFQPFKTVLLVAGLRGGRPGEEKSVPLYSQFSFISSIMPTHSDAQSSWARKKLPCARPMAYTRHFQPLKTVLLVAGLRARRPGKEKLVPLFSQILLISTIIPTHSDAPKQLGACKVVVCSPRDSCTSLPAL